MDPYETGLKPQASTQPKQNEKKTYRRKRQKSNEKAARSVDPMSEYPSGKGAMLGEQAIKEKIIHNLLGNDLYKKVQERARKEETSDQEIFARVFKIGLSVVEADESGGEVVIRREGKLTLFLPLV